MSSDPILVSCTLSFPGEKPVVVNISSDITKPGPIEVVDDSSFSFGYTGRHDHGDLLPQTSSNVYSHVVQALIDAKVKVDEVIKPISAPSAGSPPKKKSKTIDSEDEISSEQDV